MKPTTQEKEQYQNWATWPIWPWKEPFCLMVVVYHTISIRVFFHHWSFHRKLLRSNKYCKEQVFLVQLSSWFPEFLSLVRMTCCVLNKCVPKCPLSPLFCISRKSTLTFRGLAGAITTEGCSWEKEKRNIIVDASFLVSAKQTAKRSWEVDNVVRIDRSLHSSGTFPEE